MGVTMNAHLKAVEFDPTTPTAGRKTINLALQGGGSHGAFTWGVLDRFLEEDQLTIDGISATSAGSINAVVLACGLAVGGREGAKDAQVHPVVSAPPANRSGNRPCNGPVSP